MNPLGTRLCFSVDTETLPVMAAVSLHSYSHTETGSANECRFVLWNFYVPKIDRTRRNVLQRWRCRTSSRVSLLRPTGFLHQSMPGTNAVAWAPTVSSATCTAVTHARTNEAWVAFSGVGDALYVAIYRDGAHSVIQRDKHTPYCLNLCFEGIVHLRQSSV